MSVVTTLYRSECYIDGFYARVSDVIKTITPDYEIIFVNDGSPDGSLDRAVSLAHADKKVRVIDLTRNFGHHAAVMAGLGESRGELVFYIDSDLEEPPELLSRFYGEWLNRNGEADVIYGVQDTRGGGVIRKVSGNLFYKLFNFFSDVPIPENLCMARLMTRRFVDSFLKYEENQFIFSGVSELTGYVQAAVPVTRTFRGKSSYSFSKRLMMAVNMITSFSRRPLQLIFLAGILMNLFSFCYICYLIFYKLFYNIDIPGYTSLMVSIWMVGGILTTAIGILGIYLSTIFIEVKRRPRALIKHIYGNSGDEGSQ